MRSQSMFSDSSVAGVKRHQNTATLWHLISPFIRLVFPFTKAKLSKTSLGDWNILVIEINWGCRMWGGTCVFFCPVFGPNYMKAALINEISKSQKSQTGWTRVNSWDHITGRDLSAAKITTNYWQLIAQTMWVQSAEQHKDTSSVKAHHDISNTWTTQANPQLQKF